MKNKYVKRAKISEAKFCNIIKYFTLELDAQMIAALMSLNRNTVNRYIGRIRSRIVDICETQAHQRKAAPPGDGDHGQGSPLLAYRKTDETGLPVFAIRSRHAHIYTMLLANGTHRRLRRLVQSREFSGTPGIPKEWRRYDGIVDLNGRCHYRLGSLSSRDDTGLPFMDHIEAFLEFARKRLTSFHLNGDDHFYLDLKECEFRFNNRDADLYKLLLKRFRETPLA